MDVLFECVVSEYATQDNKVGKSVMKSKYKSGLGHQGDNGKGLGKNGWIKGNKG